MITVLTVSLVREELMCWIALSLLCVARMLYCVIKHCQLYRWVMNCFRCGVIKHLICTWRLLKAYVYKFLCMYCNNVRLQAAIMRGCMISSAEWKLLEWSNEEG